MAALETTAQITVDCNNKVGLGAGNTAPSFAVDILGTTAIRPSSTSYYATFTNSSSFGWILNSSAQYTGYIGYYGYLYGLTAQYVYASNIVYSSDERLKKNIQPLYSALPVINKLRPVTFDYNKDYSQVENADVKAKLEYDDQNRLGFVAQEVQQILPQSVLEKESDSTLGIRMIDFIPLLVKGMQEQNSRIDSLNAIIAGLKASQSMQKSASITGTGNQLNSAAILYQNNPNPFSEKTTIKCFVPESCIDARLLVFDMQGTLVKTTFITGRLQTEVIISGAELLAGMYIYSLVVDGKEIDSKRMILTE